MNFDRCIYCHVSRAESPFYKYFRFPKDEERCKKWILACNLESLLSVPTSTMYKKYRLCSLHFQDDDYASAKRRKLKLTACPSKFESFENNITISNLQESLKSKLANVSVTGVDETTDFSSDVLECEDVQVLPSITKKRPNFTESVDETTDFSSDVLECEEVQVLPSITEKRPNFTESVDETTDLSSDVLECEDVQVLPSITKKRPNFTETTELTKKSKCTGEKQGQPEVPKKLYHAHLQFLIPLSREGREKLTSAVEIPEQSNIIIENVKQERELITKKGTSTEGNTITIRSPVHLMGRSLPNSTDTAKEKIEESLNSRNSMQSLSDGMRLPLNERNTDKYGNRAFLLSFLPVMDSYPPHLCLEARMKIAQVFRETTLLNAPICRISTVESLASQKTSC